MLVNLTPDKDEIARRQEVVDENLPLMKGWKPQSDPEFYIEPGVYWACVPFNFSHREFKEFEGIGTIPFKQNFGALLDTDVNQHGVADNVAQVKEHFADQIADPERKFFIYLTPVLQDKENAGEGGGWRWHKWGPYIGELEPQMEYLDDEDFGEDFTHVICFHIVEVL